MKVDLNMKMRRIISAGDPLFSACMSLYEESFPYEERKDRTVVERDLEDGRFHFNVFLDDSGALQGIFTFWQMEGGYLYGEHFAVLPGFRGAGIGAEILRRIKEMGQPIILEIEIPADELTVRRRNFYGRNGFLLNGHRHFQPPYHADSEAVETKIMTWPREFSAEEYERFRKGQLEITPAFGGKHF